MSFTSLEQRLHLVCQKAVCCHSFNCCYQPDCIHTGVIPGPYDAFLYEAPDQYGPDVVTMPQTSPYESSTLAPLVLQGPDLRGALEIDQLVSSEVLGRQTTTVQSNLLTMAPQGDAPYMPIQGLAESSNSDQRISRSTSDSISLESLQRRGPGLRRTRANVDEPRDEDPTVVEKRRRNTEAARRSRQKKQAIIDDLERECSRQRAQIAALSKELERSEQNYERLYADIERLNSHNNRGRATQSLSYIL